MNRQFKRRYLFTGKLALKTGLHIGGGQTLFSASDSPVIRTPDGAPFIPGSSFKGAFRSVTEKLAAAIGLRTCWLESVAKETHCMTPQESPWGKAYRVIVGFENRTIPRGNEEAVEALKAIHREDLLGEPVTSQTLADFRDQYLCPICQLFGSPYTASKINFSDLYAVEDTEGLIQIRDGVAIDRDSERAVDKLLYNYEVVAASLSFELEISLEEPTETDLGLTGLGLSEFLSGFGYIGGKRSRGLGQCEIQEPAVYFLDLTTGQAGEKLLKYLTGRTPEEKMERAADPQAFINGYIKALLAKGAADA